MKQKTGVQLTELFLVFLKIGAFAMGGGYAMLSLVEKEVVEKRNWLTSEELLQTIAVGQMAPGAWMVNYATFIGSKLRGFWGAVCCAFGLLLPPFLIVLLLSVLYVKLHGLQLVSAILKGVKPAVVGLLLGVVVKMARPILKDWRSIFIAALPLSAVLLAALTLPLFGGLHSQLSIGVKVALTFWRDLNPIVFILLAGLLGLFLYRDTPSAESAESVGPVGSSESVGSSQSVGSSDSVKSEKGGEQP